MIALSERGMEALSMRRKLERHLAAFLDSHRGLSGGTALAAPLHRAASDFILSPGKRVRPLLFLMGAKVFGGGNPARDPAMLSVAASLELLHGFILIHDDLIDRSDTRRGRPTLHRAIGDRLNPLVDRERTAAGLAMVMGDLVFALSQQALLESGLPCLPDLFRHYIRYTCDTGLGEISDILLGVTELCSVQRADIEAMYAAKTGRYTIECPLVLAAVASGLDASIHQEIAAFSEPLGLAFQIQNDLDEFEAMDAGGPVPPDLLEGKKTWLIHAAYELLDADDRARLELFLNGLDPSVVSVSRIRELVIKAGAPAEVRRQADRLFALAETRIRESAFDFPTQEKLIDLIGGLCAFGGMPAPAFTHA